jgi:alpha-beta hydrolase superfamily lysophospholipase
MSSSPVHSSNPPTEQGRLTAGDGVSLAWYRWDPAGNPHGSICLTHGLGEHAGRYRHVARAFAQAGFSVLAFDLRGHGKSEGPRGHSPDYRRILDDLGLMLRTVPARPCLVYGHSVGGQLVLNRAMTQPEGIDAVIATGPWLRLAFPAPALRVLIGRTLCGVLPALTLPSGLETAALSRDPEVVAAYRADPLVHDRLSTRFGIDLLDEGQRALDRAGGLSLPVLLMHGSEDRIIDPEATRQFFERAGSADKRLRIWPGLYHEIHNEPEWESVLQESTGWALSHAG